jgi:two-component system chemotaxis response regulator CheB
MQTRDVIVVGSSMGGVKALSLLVRQLPRNLPAAVLIVQHTSAESPGLLAEILNTRGALPAATAVDRMPLQHGRIYVAPPDRHLLLTAEGIRVVYGPRENRARPSIDPLFRTAAVHYRSRVIGVILTGLLGDGAAGLVAVHRCGGAAVVQAPDDAAFPEMPMRALSAVAGAHATALAELGSTLTTLVSQPAPEPPPVPEILKTEVRLTERAMRNDDWGEIPSRSTDFTCPECNGAIREIEDEPMRRYRCRVGHAYSSDDLLTAKDQGLEDALWLALQTLQERSQMLGTMADEDRRRGWTRNAEAYEERAKETRVAASQLRELIGTLATAPQ